MASPKGWPSRSSPKASEGWRRERDSNPRTPFEVNGFQDRRLKPLGHLSGQGDHDTGAGLKTGGYGNDSLKTGGYGNDSLKTGSYVRRGQA